ncbi:MULTISPECIES: hypothetical protein [unclassified Streptomyces]|uniref:hypothetical protein n=1 Tax=unclassified Streptomyces TaxID=2593676 RepID=UPI001F03B67C|nr:MULTISPECIES: hypothetical protein [unclassified Streptomyces]MCH0562095.1 hypothetical protein [Streptomyces sp. MUM 2J]MCH0568100.1 hypothetical protein [Streptomyces sp. MUM 136J]
MGKRGTQLSAAVLLVAAVPVAVWGLMGQQNAQGLPPSELDHAFRPPDVSDGTAAVLGAVAVVLGVLGAALLLRAGPHGGLDSRWWAVLGPLMVAGALAGVGLRVLTAGVIGANIGAGLVILAGGPVIGGLLLWALVRGVWLARERSRR